MPKQQTDFVVNAGRTPGPLPLPGGQPQAAEAFHRSVPGYRPSPFMVLPELAARLGIAELQVKHESDRFGLPAYKALGAFWAAYRALAPRAGLAGDEAPDLRALAEALSGQPLTLLAATDGNHGHAVARAARLLGLSANIFVPAAMTRTRRETIAAEGAEVTVVAGSYDDAVSAAAASRADDRILLQDTAWPGYEDVPRWIVDGYATIFRELESQLEEAGRMPPTHVFVPIGVGSLAAAAAAWYRRDGLTDQPKLVGVEPLAAACLLESARQGKLTAVPGPHDSRMAGLNCGDPSRAAWPVIRSAFDAFVAIPDERALEAVRLLAAAGSETEESGAASLGGLLALAYNNDRSAQLGLTETARVLVLVTEGVTDREEFGRIVAGTA